MFDNSSRHLQFWASGFHSELRFAWIHPTALDDRWFAIIDWMLPIDNWLPGALATLSFVALSGGHPLAQLVSGLSGQVSVVSG